MPTDDDPVLATWASVETVNKSATRVARRGKARYMMKKAARKVQDDNSANATKVFEAVSVQIKAELGRDNVIPVARRSIRRRMWGQFINEH